MSDQKQPEPRVVEGKGGEVRLEWGENPPSSLVRIKILANNVRGIASDPFTYGYSAQTVGLYMGELLKLAEEVALELFELVPLSLRSHETFVYAVEVGNGQVIHVRFGAGVHRQKRYEVCQAVEACFYEKAVGKNAEHPVEQVIAIIEQLDPAQKAELEQSIRECAATVLRQTGEFIDSKELEQLKADLAEARAEMVKQSESAKELRERLKVAEARVRTDEALKRDYSSRIEKLRAQNRANCELIAELREKANRPSHLSAYLSPNQSFLVVDAATSEATVYRVDEHGSLFVEKPALPEVAEFEDAPEFAIPGTKAECVHCGSKARITSDRQVPICHCPGARERRRLETSNVGECTHCGSRVALSIHGGRIPLCNCPAAREERLKEAESGERDLETIRVLRDHSESAEEN